MKTSAVAALAVLAFANEAYAVDACYLWDIFPNERFDLDVKSHSLLTGGVGGPAVQTAYSVHGKGVNDCGPDTLVTVSGTVVTASNGGGAHLGLTSHTSRADDSCRSVVFDCTTEETNPVPDTWTCFSRNEFDTIYPPSHLLKGLDDLCSRFLDSPSRQSAAQPAQPLSVGGDAGGLSKKK
jgi:hypothetical protein